MASPTDYSSVRELFFANLRYWNARNAAAMASLYTPETLQIGFDGSLHVGAVAIEAMLTKMFAEMAPPPFVGKVQRVVFLSENVAQVQAVIGMVTSASPSTVAAAGTAGSASAAAAAADAGAAAGAVAGGDNGVVNPAMNAVQTLLAKRDADAGQWKVLCVQNTPAAYHGRPEDSAKLTEELQEE